MRLQVTAWGKGSLHIALKKGYGFKLGEIVDIVMPAGTDLPKTRAELRAYIIEALEDYQASRR